MNIIHHQKNRELESVLAFDAGLKRLKLRILTSKPNHIAIQSTHQVTHQGSLATSGRTKNQAVPLQCFKRVHNQFEVRLHRSIMIS
jgi:hypothetical protein